MSPERVFARGSNVLEHWLLNAEGFAVCERRSRIGVVRRVRVDPARGRADELEVASPLLGRRRVVPAAAVALVDPEARVLRLETPVAPLRRGPRARPHVEAALGRGRRAAGWLAPRLHAGAVATLRGAVRCSRFAARRSAEAAVWLRPRLRAYGEAAVASARRLRG